LSNSWWTVRDVSKNTGGWWNANVEVRGVVKVKVARMLESINHVIR
jgi:hypothetical protein